MVASEKCWTVTSVLLIGGLVSIFLTLDVPYLLFMRKSIEPSIDEKINIFHMSTAGILVLICIMLAVLAIFSTKTPENQAEQDGKVLNYPLIFLGGLVLLQFILTVVMFARMSGVEKGKLEHNVGKYWQFKKDSIPQRFVDDIQISLLCCGVTGVDDYGAMDVPPSCCEDSGCDKDRAFQLGCYEKLSTLLLTQAVLPMMAAASCLIIVAIGLAGIGRMRLIRRGRYTLMN